MKYPVIRLVFLIALTMFFALPSNADTNSLLFPLKYQKSITATFGEYRMGHPHAGVDFSTGLQNGRLVLAADSGDVIRVKISYFGYGKVIYQRTSDGRILVYAHLSGFAPKIDKLVKAIQKENGNYTFSRFFSPGELSVTRGETLGYSGDTGTDVPHLHFEVRNSSNFTLNPLKNGISITDTIPPVIQKLHVMPIDYNAQINGEWHEKILTFTQSQEGVYTLEEPVRVGGKTGLAVKVTDYADNTQRLLNPYKIEFLINGEIKFLIQYDKFDYGDRGVSELDYVYRLKENRQGSFHRLYRLHRRTIFNPENLTGDISKLQPGQYNAQIIASDCNGNVSKANFKLVINLPPKISSVDFENSGDNLKIRIIADDPDGQVTRVSLSRMIGKDWVQVPAPALGKGLYEATITMPTEFTEFKVIATDDYSEKSAQYNTAYSPMAPTEPAGEVSARFSFDLRESVVSLLLLRNAGFSFTPKIVVTLDPPPKSGKADLDYVIYQQATAIRINAQIPKGWKGGTIKFSGIFKSAQGVPYSGNWELPLQMVLSKGNVLVSADSKAKMIFPVNAAYTDFPCMIHIEKVRAPGYLQKITPLYSFSEVWKPLQKRPRISIKIPDGTPRIHEVGLYLYDRGVWWYMGNDRQKGYMTASVNHIGFFALMRDTSAPDIGDITPSGVISNQKPTIEVQVSDAGSGIFSGGIDFKLNGKRRIVEYHPYHKWVQYIPEKPLPVGTHKVVVTITDRAGFTSTRSGSFTISR